MHDFLLGGGYGMGGTMGLGNPLFVLVLAWSLVWKGLALWKSARNGEKAWFVALLIVNTLGLLEILYIYVFSKKAAKIEI
jgi:methionyl-tRNA synthetase